MAVTSSFKQKCPSCESMVNIKDGSLIGKKVECSKCKYRFIVENPAEQDKAAVDEGKKKSSSKAKDADGSNGHSKGNGATKTSPKKRFRDDEEDDEKPAKGKSKKARDDDDDEKETGAKKKKGGSGLMIGLILGGVCFLLLVVAGVLFVVMGGSGGGSNRAANTNPGGGGPNVPSVDPAAPNPEEKKQPEVPVEGPGRKAVAKLNNGPDPALTNLLPNDSEHVFHLFARDVLAPASPLRGAAFDEAGTLVDADLKKRIGFSPLAVDDLLRAERFTNPGWTFTVLRLNEAVDEELLTEALGLEKKAPIKGKLYYEATKPNPWFDQLARIAVGVPTGLRSLAGGKTANRPMFVHVHGPQTLIFADASPLEAFLKAGSKFQEITPRPVITQPAAPAEQPGGQPGVPGPMGLTPPGMTAPGGIPAPAPGGDGPPAGRGSGPRTPPGPAVIPSGGVVLPGASLPPEPLPEGAERASFNPSLPAQGAAQAMQGQPGGTNLAGTTWEGSETLEGYGKLRFAFKAAAKVTMTDARDAVDGTYSLIAGRKVVLRFSGVGARYEGEINGQSMSGIATNNKGERWEWTVTQQGGNAGGAPAAGGPMNPGIPMPGAPGGIPMPGGSLGPMPGAPAGIPMPGAPGGFPMPGAPGGFPMPGAPGGFPMPGAPNPGGQEQPAAPVLPTINPRDEMYLTIKPTLKAMMDKMEQKAEEADEKILLSSATDMEAARVITNAPEFRDRVVRLPRQFWDLTYVIEEQKPRMRVLGVALVQKDLQNFQVRNEFTCAQEVDAKEYRRNLKEKGAPAVARFFRKLLDHNVDLPSDEEFTKPAVNPGEQPGGFQPPGAFAPPNAGGGPRGGPMGPGGSLGPVPPSAGGGSLGPVPPSAGGGSLGPVPPSAGGFPTPGGFQPPGGFPPPGGQPAVPETKAPEGSYMVLRQKDNAVVFELNLVLDSGAFGRLHNIASIMAMGLRAEMDLAAGRFVRHDLARAGKELADKGLSERQLAPGQYPPGAFPRTGAKTKPELEPKYRLSWMTALLPHLGQDALYAKINYDASWRDPSNWIAGRAVVPQFLDPAYPAHARHVTPDGLPVDLAATHFVGIAGVGLDAADYDRDDPAFIARRGVLGYDRSASVEEVQKSRGLSNTVLLIQVPHDGPAGVSPWIAGGGATLRGVPEKNSIAPFVLTNDKAGKPIQHKGKRGTFVAMTDGSVRFVDANVSDEVFQAMVTLGGPAPENFNLDKNDNTPKIAAPKRDDGPKETDDRPRTPAPKSEPAKDAPAGKTAAAGVPKGWIEFKSPVTPYTVALPGQPKEIKQPAAGLGDVRMFLAMDLGKGAAIITAALPLPPGEGEKFTTPEGARLLAQGMASQGGKITGEKEVTHDGRKGREYQLVVTPPQGGPQVTTFLRMFVDNDHCIMLISAGPAETPGPEVQAFFNSLKFGK